MPGSQRGWILLATVLAVALPATLTAPVAAQATGGDPAWQQVQEQRPVPGHAVGARGPLKDPGAAYDLKSPPTVTWPGTGTAVVRPPGPAAA
ncbi:hypothetical protein ACWEPN_25205, partial [Nonomuraea wenchangensis]